MLSDEFAKKIEGLFSPDDLEKLLEHPAMAELLVEHNELADKVAELEDIVCHREAVNDGLRQQLNKYSIREDELLAKEAALIPSDILQIQHAAAMARAEELREIINQMTLRGPS